MENSRAKKRNLDLCNSDESYLSLLANDARGYETAIKAMEKIKNALPKSERYLYDNGIAKLKKCLKKSKERGHEFLGHSYWWRCKAAPSKKYKDVIEKVNKIRHTTHYHPSIDDVYSLGEGVGYGLVIAEAFSTIKTAKDIKAWKKKEERIRKEFEKIEG